MSDQLLVNSLYSGVYVAVGGILLWYIAMALFPKADYKSMGTHAILLFVLGVALYVVADMSGMKKK